MQILGAGNRGESNAAGDAESSARPVAYLVSRYPAVNHTFILREIRGLRARGLDIRVASVLEADRPPEGMSADEREEARRTFYIRPAGVGAAIAAAVRVLTSRPAGFFRGLAFAVRSSRWNLLTLARHLRYFSEALVAGSWMERERIARLHTHFASTPALFTSLVFPIELSVTVHGPDEFTDPTGFLLPEKVAAARFVIAISSYGRGQLMRFSSPKHWRKLHVVRLGVDPAEFVPQERRAKRDGPFEIICVGRLAPVKAQLLLIEACAALIAEGRDVLLRLVGDGPSRADLEAAAARLRIQDRVVFHGALSHDRVLDLYLAADAFALASFAEGIPVVLMEALALELPCIATSIMGVPELIRDGCEGLLVPPSDVAAVAKGIERLIDDPELRNRLGSAGRAKVLQDYNLERNITRLGEYFQTRLNEELSKNR